MDATRTQYKHYLQAVHAIIDNEAEAVPCLEDWGTYYPRFSSLMTVDEFLVLFEHALSFYNRDNDV